MTTYRIDLERDEGGAWVASCRGIRGCHTYGRSLQQARNRIREALALWVDDAEDAELDLRVRLPRTWRDEIRSYLGARARAIDAERAAQDAAASLAYGLTQREGLSMRDAAELIGLSHQRVQQLVAEHERQAGPTDARRQPRGDGPRRPLNVVA